jgi:hypothetical protein
MIPQRGYRVLKTIKMKEQVKIIADAIFEMAVEPGTHIYEETFKDENVYVEFEADITVFPMEETTGYRRIRVEGIDVRVAEFFNENTGRVTGILGMLQKEINEKIQKNWML